MNRKLLEIIALFNKQEIRDFRLFLASPYFNKGVQAAQLILLADWLIKYIDRPEHPALQKEAVCKALFGEVSMAPQFSKRLDNLGSALLVLTEKFLHQQGKGSVIDTIDADLTMLRFYRQHKMEKRFWQTITAAREKLDAQPARDHFYWHKVYELNKEVSNFSSMYSTLKKDLGTEQCQTALDHYIAGVKLEMMIVQQMHTVIFNAPVHSSVLSNAILEWINKYGEQQSFLTTLLYDIYDILKTGNVSKSRADALEATIQSNAQQFTPEIFQFLCSCSRSFVIQVYLNTDDRAIIQWAFERIATHLARGWMYVDGKIPTTMLRNCIVVAMKAGQVEWTRQTLEDHPPERIAGTKYPNDFYLLNWSYFYFKIKDYEQAENTIRFASFEYTLIGMLADMQLIQVYFETNNPLIEARLQALTQRNKRSKLPEFWKLRFQHFLLYMNRLQTIRTGLKEKVRHNWLPGLRSETEILEKEWLIGWFERLSG